MQRGTTMRDCPRTGTFSRSLLGRKKLLAGLRPPRHLKATCPRAISWGVPSTSASGMERLSGLREGQRNPPPMGTAIQTRLPGGRGDENESLLPNLQKTKKRESKIMSPCWLGKFPKISPLGRERTSCSDKDFEPLGYGTRLAECLWRHFLNGKG